MDYIKWGREYLAEAKKIQEYIARIRTNWKEKSQDERLSVNQRTSMLYEMYLECLHTGNLLTERGERYENKKSKL